MTTRDLAEKIYEGLNKRGAGLGNASIGIINQTLESYPTPVFVSNVDKNLYISDTRQQFIKLVEERINSLEKEMNYTKQGQHFYDQIQERIHELTDLLSDMKNVT